ncbi:hypothetical protein E2C01_018449 [Portunus trituberculatus]|uniref:Uncharacterized protein n=1 Tax=Portunus trituberculatus TaxID=210409 RepID=A0A5B7DWF8_PORTR|nr:hypothetical protein [Portunus trituberculatus]
MGYNSGSPTCELLDEVDEAEESLLEGLRSQEEEEDEEEEDLVVLARTEIWSPILKRPFLLATVPCSICDTSTSVTTPLYACCPAPSSPPPSSSAPSTSCSATCVGGGAGALL